MANRVSPAPSFNREDTIVVFGALAAGVLAGLAHYLDWPTGLAFALATVAIALLASLVGLCVDQLGQHVGPGLTVTLQSALGNLPELFICLFALKAGLAQVVQAALIGSILGNLLFVGGLAILVGGLKHGSKSIDSTKSRLISILMFVAVAAMVFPSMAHWAHAPAEPHVGALSVFASVVLLVLFGLTLPAMLRTGSLDDAEMAGEHEPVRWSLGLSLAILAIAGVGAAFVSDWFVSALTPTMDALGITETFAGLVVVALAGNAIENFVGIQLAWQGKANYAWQIIVVSPLQIALTLAPILVIVSHVFGTFSPLDLVFSPLLVTAVLLSVLITYVITEDGESNWLEGASMIGLYALIGASFWWG